MLNQVKNHMEKIMNYYIILYYIILYYIILYYIMFRRKFTHYYEENLQREHNTMYGHIWKL